MRCLIRSKCSSDGIAERFRFLIGALKKSTGFAPNWIRVLC